MNHLKTGNAYFAQGSYKSNKYNGKELQETGMYSYGWREYMPDIGRWNAIDQLAENYLPASPYAYVLNNPVNMFDPDGRISESFITNIMGFPSGTSFHNNNDGSWGINGGSMAVNDNGVLLSGHSAGGGSSFMGGSIAGTIELPGITLNGYGSANHWGGAISTYNINHSILYNGIAGMQAAWNYANHPMDPMAWVRSDGPIQYVGGAGDPFGIWEVGGMALSANSGGKGNYILAALMITRSGNTGSTLKLLNAEKGILASEKGAFSVADWTGYPNSLAKPTGPFKLLEGAEYDAARKAANNANGSLHKANPEFKGMQIHEIHPVKFGGDPTNPANKALLTPEQHRLYNTFWFKLQNSINKK